jgi:hypothetical protein
VKRFTEPAGVVLAFFAVEIAFVVAAGAARAFILRTEALL